MDMFMSSTWMEADIMRLKATARVGKIGRFPRKQTPKKLTLSDFLDLACMIGVKRKEGSTVMNSGFLFYYPPTCQPRGKGRIRGVSSVHRKNSPLGELSPLLDNAVSFACMTFWWVGPNPTPLLFFFHGFPGLASTLSGKGPRRKGRPAPYCARGGHPSPAIPLTPLVD